MLSPRSKFHFYLFHNHTELFINTFDRFMTRSLSLSFSLECEEKKHGFHTTMHKWLSQYYVVCVFVFACMQSTLIIFRDRIKEKHEKCKPNAWNNLRMECWDWGAKKKREHRFRSMLRLYFNFLEILDFFQKRINKSFRRRTEKNLENCKSTNKLWKFYPK